MAIMRVRMMLSEHEIKKYGKTAQMMPVNRVFWKTATIPIAKLSMLASSSAANSRRSQILTNRAEVDEAGEGGCPQVLAVD